MLLKVLCSAVDAKRQDVFAFIVNLMPAPSAKDLESFEFHQLMLSITLSGQDPTYLSDLLDAHARVLSTVVGARMTKFNICFHQLFVDKCGNYIGRDLGLYLAGTSELPVTLVEYLSLLPDEDDILTVQRLNPVAEKTDDVIEQFSASEVLLSCIWSKNGQSVALESLNTLERLKRRFEILSRSSEIQRRFAVVHLDRKTSILTIMKSPNPLGPAVLVFSCNSQGVYSLNPLIGIDLMAPFVETELRKPGCGLRVATFNLLPGDIVIGLPQSIMQAANFGVLQHSLANSLKHQQVLPAFWIMPCLQDFTMSAPILFGSIPLLETTQAKNKTPKFDCNEEDLITSLSSDEGIFVPEEEDDGVVLGYFDSDESQ
jgi:hypothetical protein